MKIIELQNKILKRIKFNGLWTPDHQDLFSDHRLMEMVILKMAEPFNREKIDKVVAIDGAGFILGALIANKLKVGLILIRKKGTTPSPLYKTTFVDYSKHEKTLEIKKDVLIHKGDKLLIVDDWAETGSHLINTIKLVKRFGPKIVGISLLINEMNPKQRKTLLKYNLREIIDFSKVQKPDW